MKIIVSEGNALRARADTVDLVFVGSFATATVDVNFWKVTPILPSSKWRQINHGAA